MSAVQQLLAALGVSAAPGQQSYTTGGTYSWVCPAGVTSVSVVCVGGGGGSIDATVSGGASTFNSSTVVANPGVTNTTNSTSGMAGGSGGTGSGGVGGAGGASPSTTVGGGGGGAGGYAGSGGAGGSGGVGTAGSGGGGGGGSGRIGSGYCWVGGGVALNGQGANGASTDGAAGGGGSGATGQLYGGGGGGICYVSPSYAQGGGGGGELRYVNNISVTPGSSYPVVVGAGGNGSNPGVNGAVRIIWPGSSRTFPSTRTADE